MSIEQYSPAIGISRPVPIGLRVKVYRDHADWDRVGAWFLMAHWILAELFVCEYTLVEDPECQGSPARPLRDIEWIEGQHPGCVFVY